ncbi:MAG: PAC2 family protein [Desulfobacterales bacterium]|nr:PAC2 family protein [Desulfobacterales bacterium]
MKNIVKFLEQPQFENPSLIVCWDEDAGKLSPQVIEYLNRKIKTRSFCEIEPTGFFSLGGVAIENNVAQFPEDRFYYSRGGNLVIFKGNEPSFERYRFLNAILDVAEHYCKVKELFTINGTISATAHTDRRRVLAVFNQETFWKKLRGYGLESMNWQGPAAISSYLLWVARIRGIPGASLWTEIPFYLAASEDFQAIKLILSFLDKRFNLGLDLQELDEQIIKQNTKIARLREEDSEIDRYIGVLESGLSLSEAEQTELIKAVTEVLEERD